LRTGSKITSKAVELGSCGDGSWLRWRERQLAYRAPESVYMTMDTLRGRNTFDFSEFGTFEVLVIGDDSTSTAALPDGSPSIEDFGENSVSQ
jgi:hypothetical protein